jgi:hypothetical protein
LLNRHAIAGLLFIPAVSFCGGRSMRGCRILLFTAAACAAAISASAQATSSLRGKVIDAQSASMPGVTMQLENEQTSFARTVVSDEAGAYQFAAVPPGAYKLTAALQGFATATASVTLQVSTPATLDVRMELATVVESVTVEAKAALLNTVDATIGHAFNEAQVRQLPLMTRNVVELLSLQPGVTPTGEVIGARRDQNNVMLDGVDVNDNQTAGLENSNGGAPIPGYNFSSSGNFRESGFTPPIRFR